MPRPFGHQAHIRFQRGRSSSSAADKKVSPAPRTNQRTTRSRPPTTVQLEKPKHRYHCRLPVPHTMMQYARVPCVLDQHPMPKGVNAPMVIEMKPHSIVPLSQSRPISEEAPHRYTKKYKGDACDEIFLEAVAKIAEGDDHLGDRRIDGSTGSNRSNQKSTKESLLQFLTSAGFGPLMTGARQAAPQNFGTLRLYAAPGVRDAPNLVFCINELLFALGGTWRRGRDSNPRYPCEYAAFRVRCFQPLSHLSGVAISTT